jgi:hypothetical protein
MSEPSHRLIPITIGTVTDAGIFQWEPSAEIVCQQPAGGLFPLRPAPGGGRVTVRTDANGQATIVFPEPFPQAPRSIVVTVVNQILVVGVLVLTAASVTIYAYDVVGAKLAANLDVTVYWVGVL